MAGFAAQLLDELMGRDRDRAPTDKRREIHWEDAEVCKYQLCGFCPHELFTNTRADLGPCDKLHDPDFKKSYEKSSRCERMGYEEDFLRFLQGLLTDVERRIRRGQQRLALNNAQNSLTTTPQAAREEKVQMLTERINELVEQAEQLGCEGKVEEAQGVMKLCDQLREERSQLEAMDEKNQQQGASGAKDMEVCEVCGALLVVGDAQQRLDEHIMGKQHMGYARIRSYIEGKKNMPPKPAPARTDEDWNNRVTKEREDREKEREKEREERRKRNEEREKERERERDTRRRRSRSRDRGPRKHSRRSRSRDRDRDRDRKRRSRSRDRRRSRSRHRSRERSRRSSRERRRSRDSRRSRSRSRQKSSRENDRKSRDKDRSSRDRHRDSREREEGGDPENQPRDRPDREVDNDGNEQVEGRLPSESDPDPRNGSEPHAEDSFAGARYAEEPTEERLPQPKTDDIQGDSN